MSSAGGDPERGDDFGLPPVDIRIPDDARELDRDVQAYHRELRALRRRKLARRLSAPFTRHGLLLPLLASCLALTLLAGTLLTLLSASQGSWLPTAQSPPPTASPPAVSPASPGGQVGQPLPPVSIQVNGHPTWLRTLSGSVLAVVPSHCHCLSDLRRLNRQARAGGVPVYLVGMAGVRTRPLTRRVGLSARAAAGDNQNVLADYYKLGSLTAIFVASDGDVTNIVPAGSGGFRGLGTALGELRASRPAGLPASA